jgi:DNA-binding NarL/FixJ family response regulator
MKETSPRQLDRAGVHRGQSPSADASLRAWPSATEAPGPQRLDETSRSPGAQIEVAIADCRPLIADALAALLATREEVAVTGVITGESGIDDVADLDPDVVLVCIGADTRPGMELLRALQAHLVSVKFVLVAEVLAPELVHYVLDYALGGLLLTDTPACDIAASLDHVAHGRAVLPPGWQKALADARNNPVDHLSNRQLQVLKLLADGYSYEEIGARLFISLNTVKFHVRAIFHRLGVRNRMAAARALANR